MTPPSTEVSRGPRRRSRSAPWPLLLGTFLILVHSAAFGSANGVADGRLADTDAFTWAVRATELRTTGEWFDDTLDNVYPPVGLKQHWSRPFDVLLVAGGLLGEPIVGFSRALFGWAVALPAVLGVVAFWTLWWGYRDVLDAAGADAFALLFSLQPVILAGFMAGRADHQAFIGVLIVATLGVARRAFNAPASTSLLTALGILSAFGLWVGMEFVIVIVVLYVTLAIDWVLMRDDAAALAVRYSSVVATTSLAALIAENGVDGLRQLHLDELSIVFVVAATLAAFATTVLRAGSVRLRTPRHRVAALVAMAVVAGAALVLLFPAILDGPLGRVNPLYEATRLPLIAELQPIVGDFGLNPVLLATNLSLVPFAVYGWLTYCRRSEAAFGCWRHLGPVLIAAAVYFVLGVTQLRWLFALNLVLVVPAALGVQRLMHKAAPHAERVHLGMVGVAALAALWWLPFVISGTREPVPSCDMDAAITALSDPQIADDPPQRVMALADYGPEIMFRTPHHVFSIPNHRPQPGYTVTHEAMTATDTATARRTLARQDADLVLVCSAGVNRNFYGGDGSFHSRLVSGNAPPWLTELPMPAGQPRFRLYGVEL